VAASEGHPLDAGRVGRPHGLDGSFYVTIPRARLLTLGTEVTLAGRRLAIIRRAGTDARPILRLQGIEDRSAAEEVRGERLTVLSEEAPALAEGEWWAHELEGCEVVDGDRRLGVVTRLLELPSCEALEVSDRREGTPLLVPMVKDAIRAVDTAARRIEVDAGFLNVAEDRPPAGSGSGPRSGSGPPSGAGPQAGADSAGEPARGS
jgi:16S rRNA processing protein RimM